MDNGSDWMVAFSRALAVLAMGVGTLGATACVQTTDDGQAEALGSASEEITCTTFARGGPNGGVTDAPIATDSADPTQAGSNFGSALILQTGSLATNVKQSLVRFDTSSIPAGAIVTSATLTLLKQSSPGNGLVEVHRATAPWSESTVTWNSFGGAIDTTVEGVVNSAVSPNGQPVSVDVTTLAQAWVNGSLPNYGVALTQPGPGRTSFGASEAGNFGPRPKLVVCYAPPSCSDGVQNGLEGGVDCGGACPNACPTCGDGIQNQGESGVDCGGPCGPCATCNDAIQNQGETGVDCGGPCPACQATCSDGIQNQGETGVDCGGPCINCGSVAYTDWLVGTPYDPAYNGQITTPETGYHYRGNFNGYACWWHTKNQAWNTSTSTNLYHLAQTFGLDPNTGYQAWCYSFASTPTPPSGYGQYYDSPNDVGAWGWCGGNPFESGGFACFQIPLGPPSCNDGIQNQGETSADCGGPCPGPCPTCNDGIQNQGEGGVDCGNVCGNVCPTCSDSIQNQGEGGVDCGGPCGNVCPTCSDGIQNQHEVGVDCGAECGACPGWLYSDWLVGSPYQSGYAGQLTTQETGYHYRGEFNGYACWWHTKNQAWNTSSGTNLYHLAAQFGLDPNSGYQAWCYSFDSTPTPPSGYGQYYNSPNDVGAWGWCGGNAFESGGFACLQIPLGPPSCNDGIQNQGESSTDCGGPCPGPCPTCNDGIQNQGEGGVDCGPICGNTCPTCSDGVQNQNEIGVDCGGQCPACAGSGYADWLVGTPYDPAYNGQITTQETGYHYRGAFNGYACWWHTKNQAWNTSSSTNIYHLAAQFGLDPNTGYQAWCYSFASTPTPPSGYGQYYNSPNDVGAWGWCGGNPFESGGFACFQIPLGPPSCNDGIQNQGESSVDCGGPCAGPCPTCNDGIQNQGEGGIDCGSVCGSVCPTCNDGIQNQGEGGIDCGGPCANVCPSCNDGVQNQHEVGVDCGAECSACASGGYTDWLVGSPVNGGYAGQCTTQETGYHYRGSFNGYQCWWHTKNQAWNTSSSTNIYNLAVHFGLNPASGVQSWCYSFASSPTPPSGYGAYYDSPSDVGAWGWCGGNPFESGGFTCFQ